jgi:hypothetical protein
MFGRKRKTETKTKRKQNANHHVPLVVDVAVINLSGELDVRRLERVLLRELNFEEENTTLVWRARLQSNEQQKKGVHES